jgi:hypothetical protein
MLAPLLPVPSNYYGSRASACLGILIAVPIFFFLYDAAAHRNRPLPIVGSTTPHPVVPEVSVEPSNLSNMTNKNAEALIPAVPRLTPAKSEAVLNRSVGNVPINVEVGEQALPALSR